MRSENERRGGLGRCSLQIVFTLGHLSVNLGSLVKFRKDDVTDIRPFEGDARSRSIYEPIVVTEVGEKLKKQTQ